MTPGDVGVGSGSGSVDPGRLPVGAIVLAGGRGSRLGGVDKASLVVDGTTLLDTVLTATEGCVPRVVVGPADLAVPADVVVTREEPVFSGPAAAVAAGSTAVTALGDTSPGWVLLLACDVPRVGSAVPRLVDAAGSATPDIEAFFADDGRDEARTEWLVAIVRSDALARAIDALGPGGTVDASMRRLVGGLRRAFVSVPVGATHDIDTPADAAAYTVDDPRIAAGSTVDPTVPALRSSAVPRRTFVPEGHRP